MGHGKKRHNEPTDLSGLIAREITPPPIADISVQRLIDDCLTILYREIKNLMAHSAKGKLDANNARDLRDHLKLLFELKERENASLKGMTDEQIEDLLKRPPTAESHGNDENGTNDGGAGT